MKLVNLDNFVLLGPGSEWFWAAVSSVVVAITFALILRQLRAQGAANAVQRVEAFGSRWRSPEFQIARLHVLLTFRDGRLVAGEDPRVDEILGFFEDLNDLRDDGYITNDELFRTFGSGTYMWWRILGQYVREVRANEDPDLWPGLEALDATLRRMDARKGTPPRWIHEVPVAILLDQSIRGSTQRLLDARDASTWTLPEAALDTLLNAPVAGTDSPPG